MRGPRTQNQLQDFLDAEFVWRLKEISALKNAVRSANFLAEGTLIRASVALLYAHWEGFIKNAAVGYVSFVNNQGHSYSELQTCFVVLGFKKRLHDARQSKQTSQNIVAIDFLRDALTQRAQMRIDAAIDTESNLNSEVFKNILSTIGLDPVAYETKANLIDESLLKRRNTIAHGEYVDVAKKDWASLADEVLAMLRQFKTDIENASAQASYKR